MFKEKVHIQTVEKPSDARTNDRFAVNLAFVAAARAVDEADEGLSTRLRGVVPDTSILYITHQHTAY
ncbi:MAG: hypothetical protein K2N38_04795 [Oscillospiraceae bacterium]|nr:hypothetical protein [Oscillospiraceae bacterium]